MRAEPYCGVPIVPLYGHAALRHRLADAVRRGALPATLLFQGPSGVGKQRLALWLGQLLLCARDGPEPCGQCQPCRYVIEVRHPDLHWFFPRPRLKDTDASFDEISEDFADAITERVKFAGIYDAPSGSEALYVATIRALVRSAALAPALASRKVYVVGDADRLVAQEGSDQAANAFLKLLEEPPADTTIVLTSSEPGALLPTVRSRVVTVRVPPLREAEVHAFLADDRVLEALKRRRTGAIGDDVVRAAGGAPGAVLAAAQRATSRDQARRLLEAATGRVPADRARAALSQSASRARGAFSDTLDELTVLLHERLRAAVDRSEDGAANGAARAIEAVERAKTLAYGNVNPQLLSARLVRELHGCLG